jgi:hypothetical protein
MQIKTDYVPEHSKDYITQGKVYELVNIPLYGILGEATIDDTEAIIDDTGETIFIAVSGCAHLDFKPWTIVEE